VSGWQILLIVVIVLVLLAVGGAIAQRRRLEATGDRFAAHLDDSNVGLAAAHAEDRGWEPRALEEAARAAIAERRGGAQVSDLTLIQVVDPPGTRDDRAVFRAHMPDGMELLLTMARSDGDWYAEQLQG
jgi:hypothetical protein